MSRRTSRNNNYSSGIRPSGIFRATVTAVNGSLVNVKIPRLGLENIYEDCPVVGPTPSVNDNIFVGFLEGQTSNPVALTSTDANTGDIDSVVAGTALSGGGSSGDVTLNFAPSELSSATVSTSDKIVIADADDSDNPKTVTVQSIVDLSPVGDVTGVTAGTAISGGGTSGTVTVNFAPSELSSVTVATDDKVVIADTSDSDNPKTVTVQSIADLSTPGGSTSQIQYNNSGSFAGSANFTFDGTSTVTLTDTDAGSEAAPIIELYRNSASPADADYIGQIKFQAENDADQKVVYAKLTGKIDDASDTTEDGILEIMLQKAGSNNIAMRFTSTTMKLINSTGIEVNGAGQFDSTVDIDDDLTIGTDKFFVDVSTGKTGVGTTSPVAAIDLVGQVGDTFTTSNWRKAVGINAGNLLYWRTASSVDWGIGATVGDMYFMSSTASDNSAAPDYRMIIKGDTGNVGIGTTSPNHSLSFGTPANGSRQIGLYENGTAHYGMGTDVNRLAFYASNSSGTAERMVINSDGNVGIGDDTPSYKLDVNGTARFTDQVYVQSILNVTNDLKVDTDTLFVDVSADMVGINDSTPQYSLDVNGTIRATSYIQTDEVRDNTGQQLILGAGESQGKFSGHTNEYVYVESEQGLMVSTPSVSNFGSGYTEWKTIIRGGPADGGIRMGQWGSATGYNFIGTANYTGSEYTLLMASNHTFLSCGSGGTVYIRPSANTVSGLQVNTTGTYIISAFPGVASYYTVRRRNSDGLLGYASSSQRYKENIVDAGSDWQQIYNLRPVTFDWKESTFTDTGDVAPSDRSDFGLIAEEVASVLPKLAEYRVIEGEGDDPIPDSVDYEKLTVYLLSAVKDLKARIEVLEG